MAERTHKASDGLVNDIKTAVHGFTGTGDAIRGTVNSTVDSIFHNKQSEESRAKNDEIANHGFADMQKVERRVQHVGSGGRSDGHHGQTGVGQETGHHGVGGGHGSGQGTHFARH